MNSNRSAANFTAVDDQVVVLATNTQGIHCKSAKVLRVWRRKGMVHASKCRPLKRRP